MKKQIVATIWKPTKAKGGCAETIRLEQIGVECAATCCARYYKGISSDGCDCIVVGEEQEIDEFSKTF